MTPEQQKTTRQHRAEEHATSDVPEEWQGLPDYLLDDLESPS